MDLAFGCRRVAFEWEGFGLESFRNDTSLSSFFLLLSSILFLFWSLVICPFNMYQEELQFLLILPITPICKYPLLPATSDNKMLK